MTTSLEKTLIQSHHTPPSFSNTRPYTPSFASFAPPAPKILPLSPMKPTALQNIHERFCSTFPELSEPVAMMILKAVQVAQKTLLEGQTYDQPKSDTFPYVISINRTSFHVLMGVSGEGSHGKVTFGPLFPTKRTTFNETTYSPSKIKAPLKAARKEKKRRRLGGGDSFSPQKRNVDSLRKNMSPSKSKFITPIWRTSRLLDHRAVCLMPYHKTTLREIDYSSIENPATYIINKFCLTLLPIEGLHNQNKVHRDIKRDNLMATIHYDEVSVIDLDEAVTTFTTPKFTTGTPSHLNPRSFGSAEDSLINQQNRSGVQRPCDDMYAIGITGLNCSIKLLLEMIPNTRDKASLIQDIKSLNPKVKAPTSGQQRFTKSKLQKIGRDNPYRAFFFGGGVSQMKVGIYPPIAQAKETVESIFELPLLTLSTSEQNRLKAFMLLCLDLQGASDGSRLEAQAARNAFAKLIEEPPRNKRPRLRKNLSFEPTIPFENPCATRSTL